MAARTRNRAADLQLAQQKALEFAKTWLSANSLSLPEDMSDDAFAATMNAVTRGLVQAYAAGYVTATESK